MSSTLSTFAVTAGRLARQHRIQVIRARRLAASSRQPLPAVEESRHPQHTTPMNAGKLKRCRQEEHSFFP